jgi:hypothetical protein
VTPTAATPRQPALRNLRREMDLGDILLLAGQQEVQGRGSGEHGQKRHDPVQP